jgi:cell division protein FtsL
MHRVVNWGLMLAILVSVLCLYALKYDARQLETKVTAQERALEKLENDVTVLEAERAHLARPDRIERLARSLGMAPLTSRQYVRIDATEPGR